MQAPEIRLSGPSVDHQPRASGQPYVRGEAAEANGLGQPRPPISFGIPKVVRSFGKKMGAYFSLAFFIFGFVALSTWSADDPSLSFANGKEPQNWFGFWGSSFADLAMQFFGIASIMLLFPPLIWALIAFSKRSLSKPVMRWPAWIGGLITFGAAAGCLPVPESWPLYVGLGGVVGDAVLNIPAAFVGGYPGGVFAVMLGLLLLIAGVWLMARACNLQNGIPPKLEMAVTEDDELDQLILEQELSDPYSEHDGQQSDGFWAGLPAMAAGFGLHLAYSMAGMLRKFGWIKPHRGAATYSTQFADEVESPDMHYAGAQPHTEPVFDQVDHVAPPIATESPMHGDPVVSDFSAPVEESFDGAQFSYESEVSERVSVAAPSLDNEPIPHTDAAEAEKPVVKKTIASRTKTKSSNGKFVLPALDLLSEPRNLVQDVSLSNEALEENARVLEGVLDDFGVKGQIVQVRPGPVVTLYELEPAPGIKSSRVIGLADDIARSMSAIAARVAVVPGRNAIGIELPNKRRETVYLREQLSSKEFKQSKCKLPMCLGKTIGGEPVIADMAKMPHLLVAGTTGSGKSVAINTMILSLLYKHGPDKCKLIMIDPKMLELSIYDGIPHLLTPVVVDPKKAVVALKWSVREMEERYKKMSKLGVRNIDGFNARIDEAAKKGETISRTVQTGFDRNTGEAIYETEELDLEPMPYIVVVIDEMADLMMVAGKDIEGTVQRLAQMARAAGIHVIMATQRPSTDVITGTIKANFPTRISFQVTSKIDSRVMLGEAGAEQLLGMGDMLYMAGGGRITRVHGPFVDDQEVEDIVNHLKTQGVPQYLEAITEEEEPEEDAAGGSAAGGLANSDDPYDQAVAIVLRDRKASTSYIQRRLSVGYNKAASLIERMEQEGLISPANHAGKREILVPAEDEVL